MRPGVESSRSSFLLGRGGVLQEDGVDDETNLPSVRGVHPTTHCSLSYQRNASCLAARPECLDNPQGRIHWIETPLEQVQCVCQCSLQCAGAGYPPPDDFLNAGYDVQVYPGPSGPGEVEPAAVSVSMERETRVDREPREQRSLSNCLDRRIFSNLYLTLVSMQGGRSRRRRETRPLSLVDFLSGVLLHRLLETRGLCIENWRIPTVVHEQSSTSREHHAGFLRDMHRAVGYLLWIDKLLHSVVDGLAPLGAAKAGVDGAD